ncbi:MAG: hypothetical protein HC795_06880 [Coleofasciculaceae cyanobacterium RL_1_1]|nr:hypothetical protein [Coleofasciculaceae cyanobacterium RL_1_1]
MAARTVWQCMMVLGFTAIAGLTAPRSQAEVTAQATTSPATFASGHTTELTATSLSQHASSAEREVEFWLAARRLLAERLRTIATIRRALLLPDPEAIAAIDFDLYRNTLATERFLRQFATSLNADLNIDEPFDCRELAVTLDDRSRVYCALATTQFAIQSLFDPLSQQQDAIADLPPSTFLPGTIIVGTPGEPDRLATQPGQPFEAATPLPGVTAKPPIARTLQRNTPPAYSPPPALIDQLDAIAIPLRDARLALPAVFAISLPDDDTTLSPDRATPAASFATPTDTTSSPTTSPNRPLTYLPPINTTRPNPTGNRILETHNDHAPLVSVAPFATVPGLPNAIEAEAFVPSLLLEIAGDRLEVVSSGFDLGVIADLGAVDLDELSIESALNQLDPSLRPAFADYRPPELFADLHADRQRARLGKNGAFGLDTGVTTSLPAIANQVYLFRSIQYGLPEFIETGRALYPSERYDLARRLVVPSFDGVIAVELVAATEDGGYQVRWRLLERLPEPQIVDLYNYVNYGDARSPSW